MANLIRSSKPGSEWTDNDLKSFNIMVIDEPEVAAFFGVPVLPAPIVSDSVLDTIGMPDTDLTADEENFFKFLDAVNHCKHLGAPVGDFAHTVLKMQGFGAGRTRRVQCRTELKLLMCGNLVSAQTDVAVIDEVGNAFQYVLLVQEDNKRYLAPLVAGEPEPQLIAEALAAYQENNLSRQQDGQPPILAHTFPAIIMDGTAAIFYKIPITHELAMAVGRGVYPEHTTIIQKFTPVPVKNRETYRLEGMTDLANRRAVFECFAAFKDLMKHKVLSYSSQLNKRPMWRDASSNATSTTANSAVHHIRLVAFLRIFEAPQSLVLALGEALVS